MNRANMVLVVVLLLLLLGACSTPLPDHAGPVEEPPIPARLDSPLINKADALAGKTPDKNYVRLLEIGSEALLARIHLIRSARKSIEIQTMIWANDEAGRLLIYELIQAARRGVKVRLLIDHVASEPHIEIAHFLGYFNDNFEIRFYNPVTGLFGQLKAEPNLLDKLNSALFKFDRTNRRMHNKTFIVDGRLGITGGRNYQNAYYDQAHGLNFKDRDILVVGPVAAEMQGSFEQYWGFKRSVPLTDLADVKKHHEQGTFRNWHCRDCFALNGFFDRMDKDANRPGLIARLFVSSLMPVEEAYFIADDPSQSTWSAIRDNGHSMVAEELAGLVSRARETVTIQTPYLVLSTRAIKTFKALRRQNPQIDLRVSTNSLAATDSWYVYALTYKQKKTFLEDLGFKIFEFMPRPGDLQAFMPNYLRVRDRAESAYREKVEAQSAMPEGESGLITGEVHPMPLVRKELPFLCMHSKSLVVDGSVSFVGSYNLDPRSENINTECGLIIKDAGFAKLLSGYIEVDMQPQNAWVIAKKKRQREVDDVNAILVELSSIMPIGDIWPFRYSASYQLKHGREPVGTDHPQFYSNYKDVGNFPQVKLNDIGKEIGVRGTKMFLGFVRPLL